MRLATKTAVLALSLVLFACGSDDSDKDGSQAFDRALAAVRGLDGPERESRLRELAREEGGKLSLYTSLTDETQRAVAKAFGQRYGIDVSVYRASSEDIVQRASEEYRAGHRGADVVETNDQETSMLARTGMFVPYESSAVNRLVEGARHDGWIATRLTKFVVTWNTDLVSRGTEPRSWAQLADPRWRGKLLVERGDVDWYRALREHWTRTEGKSEEEADRLFEAIARNSRVVDGHQLMDQLLAAGEAAVAVTSYLHNSRESKARGAPVSFEPFVEPVFTRHAGAGLVETARHPAAALLFIDWFLSDGQDVLERHQAVPARRDLARSDAAESLLDAERYARDRREWAERFDRLLRLGRATGRG
jgi:iron(III) transport system substrate-binding protein